MASLVALQYGDVAGASRAAARVARSGRATSDGAALDLAALSTAWWTTHAPSPRFRPIAVPASRPLGPAFWGLFFGAVLYLPLVGAALGRTTGTDPGLLADLGIGDAFVNRLRDQLVPGTSVLVALLVRSEPAALLEPEVGRDARLPLVAELDDAQERALWEVFPA